MLQREAHNAQPRTHLGKTLSSQDSRHAAAHYDVDMYDAQVRLISRDAEDYKQERHLIANDSIWEQLSFPFLQKNKKSNSFSNGSS